MSDEVEYVSRDEIRFSIIGENDAYFSKEKTVYNEFIKRIQKALDSGKSAIADATHINKQSRNKLLSNLNLEGVSVIAVYCDTPFDVCLERNDLRTGRQKVPYEEMKSMHRWSSQPKVEEGFELIMRLSEEE